MTVASSWPRRRASTRTRRSPSDVSMRSVRSPAWRRKRSTSRVAASRRPARRRMTAKAVASEKKAISGRTIAATPTTSLNRIPGPRSARPSAKFGEERRPDFEQVADHDEIGEVGDRRVGIAIDGDDGLGGLHADLVLDGATDPERQGELRLHDLACLADL